jgi:lipoprotein-releasing system ATP-binding protein
MSQANENTAALSARGVRKSFTIGKRELEVLHGVDLDLLHGELLCLMGSSGAGKTTLLNILGLLDEPTEGDLVIQGEHPWKLTSTDRAAMRNSKIGFVFQFYHLLAELNAVENAILPAMIAHSTMSFGSKRKEYTEKAEAMLESFGLADRMKHRPGQMSGGEQQRVAIARALLLDPPILIADEPTGNLDRATGEKVLELLFREQAERNLSLLLVTHDERLAARCKRIVFMEDGLVQADSTTPMPH